jgi:site-specific DNA-methyltransferase (adenine-specific)
MGNLPVEAISISPHEGVGDIPIQDIDRSPYQPRMIFDEQQIDELAKNIEENGLIHPICLRPIEDRYELLAGERRLRAAKALEWNVIRAEIRDVDDFKARKIVLSENIQRVDLTPIEEINAFAEWVDVLMCEDAEYAKIDKPPIERLAWLLNKLESDRKNGSDYFSTDFRAKIAVAFESLPRSVKYDVFFREDLAPYLKMDQDVKEVAIKHKLKKSQAKAVQKVKDSKPEEFKQIVEKGTVTRIGDTDSERVGEVSAKELVEIAHHHTPELELFVAPSALPEGKYRVLYADPPWQYDNSGLGGAAQKHYPTLPTEEICALPVNDLAGDNAVLFLWVTNPFLKEAFQVCEAWGFEYKTNFVWLKDRATHGHLGFYNFGQHENLFVAIRGSCLPKKGSLQPSIIEAPKTKHSRKPEITYITIEEMYDGPYIELFARECREGWQSWGNEIEE